MKRGLLSVLVSALLVVVALAQVPYRIITRPKVPTSETLDRLGLTYGWHAKVPLENARDGLFSVQVIPRGMGESMTTEVVVQTVSGQVFLFDGESGTLRWSTPVGAPFGFMTKVAHNSQSILLTRREHLYILNRNTGIQRVYRNGLGERIYGYKLEGMPSAAPSADEDLVVIPFHDRLSGYILPNFDKIATARDKEPEIIAQEKEGSVQPIELWNYFDPTLKLDQAPIVTPNQVTVATNNGRVYSLNKFERLLRTDFKTLGDISVAVGHHGDIAYVGSQDYYVYAHDMERGRQLWRFPSGAGIIRQPEVNDADVFIVSQGRGLYRLDRFLGQKYWLSPTANRFLAAHYFKSAQGKFKVDRQERVLAKYIYATDQFGKLLILDGERGGVMAELDTSAWSTSVVNEWTDRVYFANSDGQVLCLHPQASRRPQLNKTIFPPRKEQPKAPVIDVPVEPKKEEEKKVEEKMVHSNFETNIQVGLLSAGVRSRHEAIVFGHASSTAIV